MSNYVGKIYFKGKNPIEIKRKIDNLPDEFDGILYYKENYLCSMQSPLHEQIPFSQKKNLSTNQLILHP